MSNPLYRPVPRGGNWRQNAVVGGYETDLLLAGGFWDLAEQTLTDLGQRPDDSKFIPAMYNARHAFELALKEGVRLLARYLRQEIAFEGGAADPSLDRDAVDKRLATTHRLKALLDEVRDLSVRADVEALPPDVVDLVLALHDLDPTGQTFRYSKVKDQAKKLVPARPDQVHVDVIALRDRLREAFTLIAWGLVGGVVDNMLDLQADYQKEASSWGP